ncbi:hypothetical protein V6N12_028366 [Hibiscus sabdariffa]|uniref:Uncharacterized protein n=1 Tax=Hibiscus sabdariffa TaxID=183260 RepID=A0ABR2F5P9_9ROSI
MFVEGQMFETKKLKTQLWQNTHLSPKSDEKMWTNVRSTNRELLLSGSALIVSDQSDVHSTEQMTDQKKTLFSGKLKNVTCYDEVGAMLKD